MPIRSEGRDPAPPLSRGDAAAGSHHGQHHEADDSHEGSWDSSDDLEQSDGESSPRSAAHLVRDGSDHEAPSELEDLPAQPPGTVVSPQQSPQASVASPQQSPQTALDQGWNQLQHAHDDSRDSSGASRSFSDSGSDDGMPGLVSPSAPAGAPAEITQRGHLEDDYERQLDALSPGNTDRSLEPIVKRRALDDAPKAKSKKKKSKKSKKHRDRDRDPSPPPQQAAAAKSGAKSWAVKSRNPAIESDPESDHIPTLGAENPAVPDTGGHQYRGGVDGRKVSCCGPKETEDKTITMYFEPVHEITVNEEIQKTFIDDWADTCEPSARFFYRQFFKAIRVFLRLWILLAMEALAFVIRLVKEIFTELFTILGDGFYKPMIELCFNSLVQPTMVCTLECFSGIKALSRPLFEACMPLAECGATCFKGCQCVRVTFDRSGDGKGRKIEEV